MPKTLEEIQDDYRKRLILPEFPSGDPQAFMTRARTLVIAEGYERIVIGMRGPYVEFLDEHINQKSLFIPGDQRWRVDPTWCLRVFYWELRTVDSCRVKVYLQRKPVDYADYRVGRWYISPFDLVTDRHPVLIEPLKKGKHGNVQEAPRRDGQAVREENDGSQEPAECPAAEEKKAGKGPQGVDEAGCEADRGKEG